MDAILCIILAGLTVMVEVYIFAVENIAYLHGAHFFVVLLGMVGMPVLFLMSLIHLINNRKRKISVPPPSVEEENVLQLHQNLLRSALREAYGYVSLAPKVTEELQQALAQVERFEKKKNILTGTCYGDKTATEAGRCLVILDNAEQVFCNRQKALFSAMKRFDADEYRLFHDGQIEFPNQESKKRKQSIFQNVFDTMERVNDENEELLLQVDELTEALSERNAGSAWDAHATIALEKLDQFIQKTAKANEIDRESDEETVRLWAGYQGDSGLNMEGTHVQHQ